MKRVAVMVASTIAFMTMASATALADYTESENVVQGAGGVAGNGGADVAALTGADTSTAAIMVVALAAVGLVALLMSRPRVAQTSFHERPVPAQLDDPLVSGPRGGRAA